MPRIRLKMAASELLFCQVALLLTTNVDVSQQREAVTDLLKGSCTAELRFWHQKHLSTVIILQS